MRKEEKVTGKYQLTVKDKHATPKGYGLFSASEKPSIMFDIRHKEMLLNVGACFRLKPTGFPLRFVRSTLSICIFEIIIT